MSKFMICLMTLGCAMMFCTGTIRTQQQTAKIRTDEVAPYRGILGDRALTGSAPVKSPATRSATSATSVTINVPGDQPTIQAAIDAASNGDLIKVFPGTYNIDEANGRDPVTGGAGGNDFNIFVNKSVTIQGVTAGGAPITSYSGVAAFVSAKRNLPTFGADAIFVEADNVTITGLDVSGWAVDNNKTIEVVGDNCTIKYCKLHGLDATAALYVDDNHYNSGTNTSHLVAYRFEGNLLEGGGPDADGIRFSSGAGWSGPVSGRVITGNTFTNYVDGIAFVGPGVDPWDAYPVGAATITGNTFSAADRRHVIAWGTYAAALGYQNPDWRAIAANNTFDKAAIAWAPGVDARSWDSPPFTNIKGIYSAIQRYAINKAVAGDTVQVLAGTYEEQLELSLQLTLRGSSSSTTIVKSPVSLVKFFTTSANNYPVVYVHDANGVSIRSLRVDGAGRGNGNSRFIGVAYYNAGGTIDGCDIKDIRETPMNGNQHGVSIYANVNTATLRTLNVSNNTMSGFQKNGMALNGTNLTATVSGNTVTGAGAINFNAQNGIQIGFGATGSITGNTVSAVAYTPNTDAATALLLFQPSGTIATTNNIVNESTVGIYYIDVGGSITGNTIAATVAGVGTSAFWGIIADPGGKPRVNPQPFDQEPAPIKGQVRATSSLATTTTTTISQNSVTGQGTGSTGLELDALGTTTLNVTATQNMVTGWGYGVYFYKDAGATLSATVNSNSLGGNTYAAYNSTGVQQDASANWWGSATESTILGLMSGSLDYTPWLNAGTDTQPVTSGFQGDFSYLNVSAASPQTGATGRIQEGVNLVSGSTVSVAAGTYNEAVAANKTVTLNGVRAGVDARGRTGSESIVVAQTGGPSNSAFSISANNVTIDGFTIQGAGTAGAQTWGINAAAGTPTSGVHITNNRFQNLYEGAHVQGPDANVSSNMTIDKNAFFDDPGDLFAKDAGIWMASAPSNNLTITNNSFSGHDLGDGGDYAAVNIDKCTNLTITNNTSHNDGSFLVLVNDVTVNVSGNSSSSSGPSGFHQSSCIFLALGNNGVTIQNNSLDAGYRGVRLASFFGTGINQNIQVLNNTITNMVDAGILVPVGTISDQLVAHGNQISGNAIGVQNDNTSPSTTVNATNNYWGSIFGPSDPTGTIEVPTSPAPSVTTVKNTIPPGNLGNGASENVNYFPWIGQSNHGAHGGGISAGAYGSPTSNSVFAGVDPAALDGVDSRDTVAPPPPPTNYVYLYFPLDPGNPLPNYSVDVKKDEASLAAAAKAWNLKALSDLTTHVITMELPVDPALPSGFKPTLYDLSTTNYVNLRSTPFYVFTTPASVIPTDFRLLIGDSTKPNVAVTAPNGGEFLVVGTPYNITWTSSDGTGVLRHYIYYSLTGGAPYTLIDSTNGNVFSKLWTPPSAASVASIKVIARDSVLNEQTDVSDHSFTILATNSISFSALAGWNLVSPAMQQGTMTPAAIFGDDYGATPFFTFQYSPLSGYSIPSTLNMGQGYWLGSNSAQVIDAVGTPVSSASLGLAAGFNIVGNPFPVAEPKDSLKFTDGFLVKTMAQAATAGWLSNVLYGYSGTSYFVENSAMAVWNGYWIPMLLSGKTIQYTPAVGVPTPKVDVIAEAATPVHWSVDLAASMTVNGDRFGDRIASFGVREDAGDAFNPVYDAPRPPRAPSKDFVEVSFPARGEGYPAGFDSYARDYRTPGKAAWTFVVRSSAEGTVTLTWDRNSISGLAADVRIELFDGAGHAGIDMKKVGSYTYAQQGTTHEFSVNSPRQAVPQKFDLTQNFPNPFNPTTKISYALPGDARVQVAVYDFLGEKVAELVNQTLSAGYHEVVFDASRLASGMYFYRITATSANGVLFTGSKKMMLIK